MLWDWCELSYTVDTELDVEGVGHHVGQAVNNNKNDEYSRTLLTQTQFTSTYNKSDEYIRTPLTQTHQDNLVFN